MPIHVDVVAAERSVFSDDVDEVLAITLQGQIGVLPHHAPLLTLLAPGELRLKKAGVETILAVSGGFLEVADNQMVVLANSAERADEIDVARAEEARRRAAARLASPSPELDFDRAQASLLRALARLRAVERLRRTGGSRAPRMPVESTIGE